ncbi:MAG: DNA primase [Candidatus Omnitrophica bacterium CG11_big_fil_rev_8_21_14_0_20_63_9]|nr:MAG: DNA primase [Candidatus Omnitrophica bacterium CG11_big_fil_rev_8_21_14_0_20_63_9]
MPLIPESIIDEILSRADIAELISRYMPLRRAGRHFKALCPFHKERTPSFTVNADKQIFHCFGCGVGGNVFSFLMQHDRLTFPEAVRQLADHVGISIPEAAAGASSGEHERLLALMEKACIYFERRLSEPQGGRAARAYLQQRGVSSDTAKRFRLGLSSTGWRGLVTAAKATQVSPEQLEAAGLVVPGKSGHYDRFRNRLMFPIQDVRGRVIGFGGRSLDAQEPKYLNSPETAVYSKGRHVFGLPQAREAIAAAKTVVLVEGYFDCVVLADAGIRHVISPLGTALTTEQARLLKRYAETVILAFDADAAGEAATLRGIDLVVEAGLQVRIAQLPKGVDPDDVVRNSGRAGIEAVLQQSIGILEYLLQVGMARHPVSTAEGKVRVARFVLPTIAKVPDAMLRREYVRIVAGTLRLDEAAVAEELAKVQPRDAVARPEKMPRAPAASASVPPGSERMLTALILDEPARLGALQGRLALEDVTDVRLQRLLSLVGEHSTPGQATSAAQIVSRLADEPDYAALVTELVALAQTVSAKDAAFEDCVRRLRRSATQRQLAKLHHQLEQGAKDEQHERKLLAEYQTIQRG